MCGFAVSRFAFQWLRRLNAFGVSAFNFVEGFAVHVSVASPFKACGVSMASPFLASLFQVSMCFARFSLRCF